MPDRGPLVVWGASGHGKVVADAARLAGFTLLGFVDDDQAKWGVPFFGLDVLGGRERLPTLPHECAVVVGVGNNRIRAALHARVLCEGRVLGVVVHPDATVATSAALASGVVVLARAVVNPDARVGPGAIINTGAVVEHDCVVGDFAHLSPGSAIGGGVTIESLAHVGLGARVLPGRRVGAAAVVGAGAVVARDVAAGLTVVGVPARPHTTSR